MKQMSLELLGKESLKEQKRVNYKQVEMKENDEKFDVDLEAKCSTKAGAERQKDLFVIIRREGRFRVTREEERVERLGVNERRERR